MRMGWTHAENQSKWRFNMHLMNDAEAIATAGGTFWEGFSCGAAIGVVLFTPFTGVGVVMAIAECGPLVADI